MSALSAIYGRAARLRRTWYERRPAARRHLSRPVISVGNLTVGGSGKTPVVAAVSRVLLEIGHRPAVLSRGYARRTAPPGVVVVSDGRQVCAGVEQSGDEPQMLARMLPGVPVLVSPDRYLAGTLADRRFDATVMVLDDGFQHLQLARTLDLLVLAPEDLDDQVLPAGRLREPLDAARSAHAVLVYGDPGEAQRLGAAVGVPTAFGVSARYRSVEPIGNGAASGDARRVVAVAGIARPQRFFSALRQQGYDVARELAYRDHHWFTRTDVQRITTVAGELGADLVVTTAKDAVRLSLLREGAGTPPAATADVRWAVLPMEVTIEPAHAFAAWLRERV